MAENDFKALEFDLVRRLLERLASTPYGADAARALEPAPDRVTAQRMQDSVSAARRLIDGGISLSFSGTPDIRAALRQAVPVGSALSGMALSHLAQVIALGSRIRTEVERESGLYGGPEYLTALAGIGEMLRDSVLANGQIRPEASPRLAELHAHWCAMRDQVTDVLKTCLGRLPGFNPNQAQDRVVWSGNRGALSLPAALSHQVKGVRRSGAASGRDHIVEPIEVIGLNNKLETMNGQYEAEQAVVRRSLTDQVRADLVGFERLVGAVTWVDLAAAAARFSIQLNAAAPQLVEEPVIVLDEAFHPGLLLQYAANNGPQPVPLSLRLDEARPMLIITGPNTGGKTVVLKTVGLLMLMARCGLHLPSEGACTIGGFQRVIVGIGDPQNLHHHLSTFAGHVEVLKRLMNEADRDTLVLLDELGTGTDPEEGAALAMAVLDELAGRGVRALITTHLPPLRAYAERHERIGNASMQFDGERLAPTYRLSLGTSGISHGLTIAGRNGLPEPLIVRARRYLEEITSRTH